MPAVFDTLTTKGYKFVTVSELIALDLPAPIQTAPGAQTAPAAPPTGTPAAPLAPRATPATTTP